MTCIWKNEIESNSQSSTLNTCLSSTLNTWNLTVQFTHYSNFPSWILVCKRADLISFSECYSTEIPGQPFKVPQQLEKSLQQKKIHFEDLEMTHFSCFSPMLIYDPEFWPRENKCDSQILLFTKSFQRPI